MIVCPVIFQLAVDIIHIAFGTRKLSRAEGAVDGSAVGHFTGDTCVRHRRTRRYSPTGTEAADRSRRTE